MAEISTTLYNGYTSLGTFGTFEILQNDFSLPENVDGVPQTSYICLLSSPTQFPFWVVCLPFSIPYQEFGLLPWYIVATDPPSATALVGVSTSSMVESLSFGSSVIVVVMVFVMLCGGMERRVPKVFEWDVL